MAFKQLLLIVVALSFVTLVAGHARMKDPAGRNSAWRYGFPNSPKHWTDNELNCGSFSTQWVKNKGKCGVCGDPYHLSNQLHVYPGKYANGIITRTYKQGQQITVLIDVTSNHQGTFTFRIGDIGTPPITQAKLTHVLKQPNGETSWKIPKGRPGNAVFSIKLVLPQDLSCDHCVMQWWWKTGNSWGCDDTGCGVGKGERQETFVNCADVKIMSSGGPVPTQPPIRPPTGPPTGPPIGPSTGPPTGPPTEPPTQPPVITTSPPNPGACKATGVWTGNANMDTWCRDNCANGYCPSSTCKCSP